MLFVVQNADFAMTKGVQDVIPLFFLAKKSIPYSCASSNNERSIKKNKSILSELELTVAFTWLSVR